MNYTFTKSRKIAVGLLFIWSINIFAPTVSYALTSGPSQPETKGFQPAGVTDMVDLQTGGLKYNIPLLDIDGYPINLSYESGAGIDDEASWVGLGWSLNPGVINRQLRGIPDDFDGDMVETDHYTKPKVTVGGRVTTKIEAYGIATVNGSFTFGVFNDNYTGIGAELGVNAGMSFSTANDGMFTAGLGAGILSNTQSGVDASASPYVSLSVKENAVKNMTTTAGLSASLGFNTRSGLKGLTLGSSFGFSVTKDVVDSKGKNQTTYGSSGFDIAGSTISYNTEPIQPNITIPYSTNYESFSFDVGGVISGIYGSAGGTGYQNVRKVKNISVIKPAYGFLYAERGKDNADAVMDFIREKDNPVVPDLPNLALPVHTPDLWSYSSQTGSGQFRLYRTGTGIFFDNQSEDESKVSSIGADLGFGLIFHGGVTQYEQNVTNITRKWQNQNAYKADGDFQNEDNKNPNSQHVYFRQVGEKNLADAEVNTQLHDDQPLGVKVSNISSLAKFVNASAVVSDISGPIVRTDSRRPNRTEISYLTAKEASKGGLNVTIPQYSFNSPGFTPLSNPLPTTSSDRVDADNSVHKADHISEITITGDDGKRMVYGIPVYNITQDEYTFAVDTIINNKTYHRYYPKYNNIVPVPGTITSPSGSSLGIDNYYHKEHKPAYSSSFLLTGILSPDYVDKTGNGISYDDLGTAVKFNYAKLPYYYKWRSPYQKSTLNKGLLADPDDDKANIIYGEKEVWYVSSIESKSKIAYFITQDRRDALGVAGWQNGGKDTTNKLKCLKEIRLYSKTDMSRPIKVVKFQYTYELCNGIPNSADAGSTDTLKNGKLTLAKVWFEYGNTDKGKFYPYTFQYNKIAKDSLGHDAMINYNYMVTDRWGTYKHASENKNGLNNEEFPYTDQDTTYENKSVALWQLKRIDLPTGGLINIQYESNDYAYVQDKKAMVMKGVDTLLSAPGVPILSTALTRAKGVRISLDSIPPPATKNMTQWFMNTYLNGSNYLYTKFLVKLSTNNSYSGGTDYDFVPCYAQIRSVTLAPSGTAADIIFNDITESSVTANPISIAAWQKLKNEYPRYAYPGYDNRIQSANSSVLAAVTSIVNAAKNLNELKENFYEKAVKQGYASSVLLGKSFVKLGAVKGFKLGGGARVKTVRITDNWQQMAGGTAVKSSYGQSYDYTTTDGDQQISSGVATYEPAVGNDENALKEPVPYMEKVKGAISNYLQLEKPFGESLYPAPAIGYSKVTVHDLDKDGIPTNSTGYTVNEFYTAKDFPVIVNVLPIDNSNRIKSGSYNLLGSNSIDELCLSQGYSIELNDMHGKVRKTSVYNQSGGLISSTEYKYLQKNDHQLDNHVNIINAQGQEIANQVMGRDIEFFTDCREQESNNTGRTINVGVDILPIPILFLGFLPIPHFPKNANNDYKLFRSVCAVKTIQDYGILTEVIHSQNGSTITTDNIAYDGFTGEPIVTKTQNEFNKNIYSVNIPAYWAYPDMGGAYQTSGVLLANLQTSSTGELVNNASFFTEGDEMINVKSGGHYWVVNGLTSGKKELIDIDGKVITNLNSSADDPTFLKVVRSGFRNMLSSPLTSVVCLNNPIQPAAGTGIPTLLINKSTDLSALKVINASANTYNGVWPMPKRCVSHDVTIENHDYSFDFVAVPNNSQLIYAQDGIKFLYADGTDSTLVNPPIPYLRAGFHRAGIWLHENQTHHTISQPIGFEADIVISAVGSKTYYVGYSGDDEFHYSIDGHDLPVNVVYESHPPTYGAISYWFMYPIILAPGVHHITGSGINYPLSSGTDNETTNPGSLALEIYDNTAAQLLAAPDNGSGINIVFSTANLTGTSNALITQAFYTNTQGVKSYQYTYRSYINPFIEGYWGNWRPERTMVFQGVRHDNDSFNTGNKALNIKDAGYLDKFYSYWYMNGSNKWSENIPESTNARKWVAANTVTQYDIYGQELENKDALGRYSAAEFDFNGDLPAAVASNAMNREIFSWSFEDVFFNVYDPNYVCNFLASFTDPSIQITNSISHTGNYSVKLKSTGLYIGTHINNRLRNSDSLLVRDDIGEFNNKKSVDIYPTGPKGFEPLPNKKYIVNAWIYDGQPDSLKAKVDIKVNDTALTGVVCKAVVEGWKLIEGTFTTPSASGDSLSINFVPTSGNNTYIDDIRIHPFGSQMKTYAYDNKTMRLMAELDENGFATFYEYDDEGLLIRVKKETERGVMTLKESRSSYLKKVTP